jgi:hypothetical protein
LVMSLSKERDGKRLFLAFSELCLKLFIQPQSPS